MHTARFSGHLWGAGCLPRECVFLGVCLPGGVCLPRGVCLPKGCLPGGVCQGGCLPRGGGCLPRGCVCLGGLPDHPPCGQKEWHTPVKILPCPKLRLRAVINLTHKRTIITNYFMHCTSKWTHVLRIHSFFIFLFVTCITFLCVFVDLQLQLRDTLEGHAAPVMNVCFSPNGKYLASG